MSYKEGCGACPRLPVWLGPSLLVQGEPAGTANEDDPRVITEQAARVPNFRASRNKGLYSVNTVPRASSTDTAVHPLRPKQQLPSNALRDHARIS
jgi:hypothetical protein